MAEKSCRACEAELRRCADCLRRLGLYPIAKMRYAAGMTAWSITCLALRRQRR